MDSILAAARIIASARRNRTALKSFPSETAPRDEAEGYRIQRAVHDLLLPQFGALVGYKIGCTSAVCSTISASRIPAPAAFLPKACMTAA